MTDRPWQKIKRLWSTWIPALFVALIASLLFFIPFGPASPWVNYGTVPIAILFFWLHVKHKDDLEAQVKSPGQPKPISMTVVDIGRAEDYIDSNYDIVAIDYFIKLLTELPDYLTRVDEDMSVNGRHVESKTTLNFRGARSLSPETVSSDITLRRSEGDVADRPHVEQFEGRLCRTTEYSGPLLLPLVRARKGLLFQNFATFDQAGNALSSIPQWQVAGLIAVTLRTLFENAFADRTGVDTVEGDTLSSQDRFVILQLVRDTAGAIVRRNEAGLGQPRRLDLIDAFNGRISEDWRRRIRLFCESLLGMYFVVVETQRQPGDNLLVGYSTTVIPERWFPTDHFGRRRVEALRTKHGLLPMTFDIPNPWALSASSYHFTLAASQDMYVYSHHLERLESAKPVTQADFTSNAHGEYVRVTYRSTRSIARLYVRRQGTDVVPGSEATPRTQAPLDFKSIVEFKEVPPGSLGNAVTVALATAVMITYFALFRVGIDPALDARGINNNQDIPALMLAIPAFLAAAVGRGMSSDRLLSASLTAFYGLWTVVFSSICAVLLYIYSANRNLPFEVTFAGPTGPLKFNMLWIGLALFAIGVYLHLRRRKAEERTHHMGLLTRTES